MIDLKAKPFYLTDEDIAWVESTLASLTEDEKLGQLFFDLSEDGPDEDYIRERVALTHMGGLRYMNRSPEDIKEHNRLYQKYSKVPLLICANLEAGGNGSCRGGTKVGDPIKLAATGDPKYAYHQGFIGATEGRAVGCRGTFSPVVDIPTNWRNSAIATRSFSDRAQTVIDFAVPNMKGIQAAGVAATIKHFPGDGVDERDQHYSNTVNSLSKEEWDATFGKVYKTMIDEGAEMVMAGHIMQPAYQKHFNPDMTEQDVLPASLCKELLTDLLRKQLGFNGMIVTDASHMVGMTCHMKRSEMLATALNAGIDMILYFNDAEEDFDYLRESLKNGSLTWQRIDEALTRVLGMKAHLGLHKDRGTEGDLSVVGCEAHQKIAAEVSDKGITLAKQTGENIFPITPDKYPKIMLMPVNTPASEFSKLTGSTCKSTQIAETLRDKLNALGFQAELFVSPLKYLEKLRSPYDYKSPIWEFKEKYDLVITIADVAPMGVTQRLSWDTPKGGFEVPWYVNELPVVFVSVNSPFHLADVPQIKNLINCYDSLPSTLDALVQKLTGQSQFLGKSPVDVFCGKIDTRK